jgi:CRP-like cAMP-binding protein
MSCGTAVLSACCLFQDLSLREVAALHALFRVHFVPRGGLFFEQDSPAAHVCVVSHGSVKLVRTDRDGRQVILRTITRPEAFGTVAALTGRTNIYSAQALTGTEVLTLDTATFLQLMTSCPQMAQNVSRVLATWVADSWVRLDDLSVRRQVGQRVARALIRNITSTQCCASSEHPITVALTEQDLADIVGASRYSVSRALSALERMGIVDVKRGYVVVQSAEGLATVAELGVQAGQRHSR